jgi:hypothetical protein
MSALTKWIKKARGERPYREFSAKTKLATGLLHSLESGVLKNPTIATLNRIASASQGRCNRIKLL